MATRQEIIDALQKADERLEGLRSGIVGNTEAPLLEGEWRVRDCLSHLAARSNVLSVFYVAEQRAAEAARGGEPRPRINIDEINHGQVEERRDTSAEDLLAEVTAGHAKAVEELAAIDDARLQTKYLNFRGEETPGADMVLGNVTRHEAGHVDQIEAALKAVAR